uniref:PGG domain-containing protein n=1 Tax=Fagus sylvatica TaxID=28930 RepID=A0A2N9FJ61_FAGSY
MDPKLFKAAMTGDLHFLESLNEDDNSNFLCQVTPKKNTVLHVAAEFHQSEFVQAVTHRCPLLFQSGNSNGDTPLHVAAKVGCCEIVEGAPSDGECGQGYRVTLCYTKRSLIGQRSLQSVKLLIEADPELSNLINNADESPLYLATSRDFRDIAELILNASPSSSSHVGPNGITALHAAVYSESQCFLFLKERYIRERDILFGLGTHYDGNTPLHMSIICKDYRIMSMLARDERVDIKATNKENLTAYAIFYESNKRMWGFGAERVRYLLKYYRGIQGVQQRISTSNLKQPPVDTRSSSSLNTESMDNADKLDFIKRKSLETNLLVAMLVATVTFAAAFTMPGGYQSQELTRDWQI